MRKHNLTTLVVISCLFASVFLTQIGTASEGWSRTIEGDGYDALFPSSIIQTSDGGFAMAVFADTKYVVETPSWRLVEQWQLWLVKTDSGGTVQWKQIYGTDFPLLGGEVYTVVQTRDGGYAIGGAAMGNEWWLIKTDSSGRSQWNKTYTYSEEDTFDAVCTMIQTKDGGYAFAGTANVYSAGGSRDFCLLKVDSAGNVQWKKTYESGTYQNVYGDQYPREDDAYSVVQTIDGGYALGGQSRTYDSADFWLVKTDSIGNEEWNQKYTEPYLAGGKHYLEVTHKVTQTSDGGYALTGSEEKSFEDNDFYLIKVDTSGNVQWRKTYGEKYIDVPSSVIQLSDGGFALGGTVTEVGKTDPISGDFGIIRTDSSGTPIWFKEYNAKINETLGGQKSEEFAYAMSRTRDGAYVIAGTTQNGWDGSHVDIFLVKTETLETATPTAPTLSLGEVTGQFNVQAPGQDSWTPATKGTSLPAGTKIKTSEASGGSLLLAETTTLQMTPNTLVEVQASTENSQKLQLLQGEFTATVKNLPEGGAFVVELSQAVATVKGTVFTVSETGTVSKLNVQEGVVAFVSKTNGELVDVKAGESATATIAGLSDISEVGFPSTLIVIVVVLGLVLLSVVVWTVKRKKKNRT